MLAACDDGDREQVMSLGQRLIDIATDPEHPACTPAFQWLVAFVGEPAERAVREYLWKHPDEVVEMVRRMRDLAQCATVSPKKRAEARRALARYGFDDDSLRVDEPGSGGPASV